MIMDPNIVLAELRTLISQWEAAGSRGTWTEAQADRTIELARDLDGWISRGGFLPDEWDRGPLDRPTGATFHRSTSYRAARKPR
jgi:hypothetical protein